MILEGGAVSCTPIVIGSLAMWGGGSSSPDRVAPAS